MKNGASDRLYHAAENGEELTFRQFMRLYAQQIDEELRFTADDEPETREEMQRYAKEMHAAKDAALEIYFRHIQAAAEEMQNSSDGYLQGIGQALESGDWSRVAI